MPEASQEPLLRATVTEVAYRSVVAFELECPDNGVNRGEYGVGPANLRGEPRLSLPGATWRFRIGR